MQDDKLMTRHDEGLAFIDAVRVVQRHKNWIMGCMVIPTVIAAVVNLTTPNRYTATTTLMPVEKTPSDSLSSLIGSFSGGLGQLASQAGLASGASNDKFVTFLSTRTLSESVIQQLDLIPTLFPNQWDADKKTWKASWLTPGERGKAPSMQKALEKLEKRLFIARDKQLGVVKISYTDQDPELAAKVANQYIIELDRFLKENALYSAKRNRLFVEGQLRTAKEEMAEYEQAIKEFQQKNKVVSLDAQAQAAIETYSSIKSKLMASEIELSILEKSTIDSDPRLSLKREEVGALKKQMTAVESGAGLGPFISFEKAPALGLNYARLKRELLVREKVFELLTQQFELAKIQESQEEIAFQVLDPAIAPERKSEPKRVINTLQVLVVSTILGVILAFALEVWQRLKRNLSSESTK